MSELRSSFLRVENEQGKSYGGNQKWFPYGFLKKSGCGVIGAANVILHLKGKKEVSRSEYMDFAKELWKYYFPVIPGIGMNGITLMVGLNRYFRKQELPYRACYQISRKKMLHRMDEMLSANVPVILSIGPNFPKLTGKKTITLYTKERNGQYLAKTGTKAHYVTVTGRIGTWLRISSWGKEYYIDLNEWKTYVRKYSSSLVSNIIYISER